MTMCGAEYVFSTSAGGGGGRSHSGSLSDVPFVIVRVDDANGVCVEHRWMRITCFPVGTVGLIGHAMALDFVDSAIQQFTITAHWTGKTGS